MFELVHALTTHTISVNLYGCYVYATQYYTSDQGMHGDGGMCGKIT